MVERAAAVMDSTWHELASDTRMVMHVEQIVGGADVTCACGKDADMLITSEPDMEPGFVCREHAFQWINMTLTVLRSIFPL